MVAFTQPAKALGFTLDLCDSGGREPQFPGLRIGALHGTVLYREGFGGVSAAPFTSPHG